jgi:peptidoglycan hydrolase CwlO-like protein
MYDNELDRLFTIKINFTNSCIEIENKLKSASLSNSEIKSLKKKVKKYESKITNIEKEIERLSNKENTNLNREIDTK